MKCFPLLIFCQPIKRWEIVFAAHIKTGWNWPIHLGLTDAHQGSGHPDYAFAQNVQHHPGALEKQNLRTHFKPGELESAFYKDTFGLLICILKFAANDLTCDSSLKHRLLVSFMKSLASTPKGQCC